MAQFAAEVSPSLLNNPPMSLPCCRSGFIREQGVARPTSLFQLCRRSFAASVTPSCKYSIHYSTTGERNKNSIPSARGALANGMEKWIKNGFSQCCDLDRPAHVLLQPLKPNAVLLLVILSLMRSAALKGSGSMTKQAPTKSSRPESARLVTSLEPVMLGGCPRCV